MLNVSRDWISLFKEPYLTKPKVGLEGEVRTCGVGNLVVMRWVGRDTRMFKGNLGKNTNNSFANHGVVLCRTVSEIWGWYLFKATRWFNAFQVLRWFSFLLRATWVIFTRATKFLGGTRRIEPFFVADHKLEKVSFFSIKQLCISPEEVWGCLVEEMLVIQVLKLLKHEDFSDSKQLDQRNYVLLSL